MCFGLFLVMAGAPGLMKCSEKRPKNFSSLQLLKVGVLFQGTADS